MEYKKKYKECKIKKHRYRLVECKTCKTRFNAYINGKTEGILYNCPNIECRKPKRGELNSIPSKDAYENILTELKERNELDSYAVKDLLNAFPEEMKEYIELMNTYQKENKKENPYIYLAEYMNNEIIEIEKIFNEL